MERPLTPELSSSPLNALVDRLESVEALDGLGRTAGRTVRALVSGGAAKDVLSGAWLGYALRGRGKLLSLAGRATRATASDGSV